MDLKKIALAIVVILALSASAHAFDDSTIDMSLYSCSSSPPDGDNSDPPCYSPNIQDNPPGFIVNVMWDGGSYIHEQYYELDPGFPYPEGNYNYFIDLDNDGGTGDPSYNGAELAIEAMMGGFNDVYCWSGASWDPIPDNSACDIATIYYSPTGTDMMEVAQEFGTDQNIKIWGWYGTFNELDVGGGGGSSDDGGLPGGSLDLSLYDGPGEIPPEPDAAQNPEYSPDQDTGSSGEFQAMYDSSNFNLLTWNGNTNPAIEFEYYYDYTVGGDPTYGAQFRVRFEAGGQHAECWNSGLSSWDPHGSGDPCYSVDVYWMDAPPNIELAFDFSTTTNIYVQKSDPFSDLLLEMPAGPANNPPDHATPPALTPDPADENDDLTCTPDTYDLDGGDTVTNIFNWYKDGSSRTRLNLPFETDSAVTATDYSGNGFDGTVGGATWTDMGQVGGAYMFDGGSNYISLNSGMGVNTWTVNVWVNANSIATGGNDIYSQGNTGLSDHWIRLMVRQFNPGDGFNIPRVVVYLRAGANRDYYGDTSLVPGTWYMLTFVRDGDSDERIYVNGVQETLYYRYSNPVTPILNTENIGRFERNTPSNWFDGTIDQFAIWDTPLSDEQIYQMYLDTQAGLSSSATIDSVETTVAENWECYVTPNDGHPNTDGPTQGSNPVNIQPAGPANNPPQHGSAPTLTSPAYNDTDLVCIPNTTDADGGDTITNIFNWNMNNNSLTVLNFPFETNNSTTTRDYSGYDNNGTVSLATWTSSGKVGRAYDFNGNNSSITVPDDPTLDLLGNFTLMAWVKLSDLSVPQSILSKASYSLKIGSDNRAVFSARNYTNGTTWVEAADLAAANIMELEVFKNYLYAGTNYNGRIYRSSDGTTWAQVYNPGQLNIRSLAVYKDYLYAGSSTNGIIYRSSDGTTWATAWDSTQTGMTSLAVFDGYLYTGTGLNGKIYRTSNGTSWTEVGDTTEQQMRAMGVFNGYLYVGSYSGAKVYRSSDGTTWAEVLDAGGTAANSFAVFKDKFYVAINNGEIWSSSTGASGNWSLAVNTGESAANSLAVFNGYLYAGTGTSADIWRTSDGTSWSEVYSGNQDYVLSLATFNGALYGGTSPNGKIYRLDSGFDVYSNNSVSQDWTHVAGTYDGSTAKLYLNGTLENSSAQAITLDNNALNLLIGNSYGSGSGHSHSTGEENLKGTIDEVRIYNRSLSAEQVFQIYSESKDGNSSNRTIVSEETNVGEHWQCNVTPNDGHPNTDGLSEVSSTVIIQQSSTVIALALPQRGVSFILERGESDGTEDNSPTPMMVENLGTVPVDVSVWSTQLFHSINTPSENYRVKARENPAEPGSFNVGASQMTYTPTPLSLGTAVLIVDTLGINPSANTALVDFEVTADPMEDIGGTAAVITFIATESGP